MARSAYAVELDSKAGEIKELRQSVEDMGKKAKAKEEAAAAEAQNQQAEHERQLKELGDQLSLIHVQSNEQQKKDQERQRLAEKRNDAEAVAAKKLEE